jgi:membrane associated rhomboid family serine protease
MKAERASLLRSILYPLLFVLLLWLIKGAELVFHLGFETFGLHPLHWEGLWGIATAPLLHAGISHLFANSVPLLILGSFLFYSYREIAWQVILLIYFMTGLWVWFLGRPDSVHIGASGLVYGMAAFLFTSGIIRRDVPLMAVTLLVTFLYGGMIWGVFPQLFPLEKISWESHLMGLLAGFILAFFYRKSGPKRKKYDWEYEEEEEEEEEEPSQEPGKEQSGGMSPE